MTYNDELYHYGVLGMRWGKRRYTNPDGTLNALGKKRQAMSDAKAEKKAAYKEYSKTFNEAQRLTNMFGKKGDSYNQKLVDTAEKSAAADVEYKLAKKDYKDFKKQTAAELKKSGYTTTGKATAGKILGTTLGVTAGAAVGVYATTLLGMEMVYKFLDYVSDGLKRY